MGKKERVPLEKRDIILYAGDWDELAAILKTRRITPTQFIRELVHRKLLQIRSASQDTHNQELPDVELALDADLSPDNDDQSIGEREPAVAGRTV